MKKATLALACLVGLALMASCKKDVQPTITASTNPEYVNQNSAVYSGDVIAVGFNVTGENLIQIAISAEQNGTVLYTHTEALANESAYFYAKTFAIDATGTITISGTVTDAKGHTASTSFSILCNEKPNAKFVGFYEGNSLITGIININASGMDPLQQEVQDDPVPVRISIEAGENIDEVIAHVTINEQENSNPIHGTVEGNKVIFEATNDTFSTNYDYNGMNIPITLNMTYNAIGTLNEGMLELEGGYKGDGDFNLFIISGTIEMEGTIGGSLTKTE